MLQQPPGFIPPAAPLVPVAANGIVATGGLAAAAAAGAAAGAKIGAFLGPKGAAVGAVVGAVVLPLVFPEPTAPGTLPEVDPGLNDPEPSPQPEPGAPDGNWEISTPPAAPATVFKYEVVWDLLKFEPASYFCADGRYLFGPNAWRVTNANESRTVYARSLSLRTGQGSVNTVCQGDGILTPEPHEVIILGIDAIDPDGNAYSEDWQSAPNYTRGTNGGSYFAVPEQLRVEVKEIKVDEVPVPSPIPEPEVETKPRPSPVPLEPVPVPQTDPAVVPIREPQPQPQPMEVPSPDNPELPPITIPKAPPAPPQEVPGPNEEPGRVPITPTPVPPPLPVPGVPTVPEPTPEPSIAPAPGPTPSPVPGPVPIPSPDPGTAPGSDPEPAEAPIPVPPEIPVPDPIAPPTTPENPQQVDPGTSIVPAPVQLPKTTPVDAHFPVPGDKPVRSGGVRPDVTAIAAEVGRIEQKVARLQNRLGGPDFDDLLGLLNLLSDLFEQQFEGTTYTLTGVCEEADEEGNQPVAEFPVASAGSFQAILNRIDALPDILQQHLEYRTPTCRGKSPEGEFRTISFISDQVPVGGKRRLAKRLCYRSKSGTELGGLIDHWKDFAWEAGPVIVQHEGAWWGTVQTWAASINEGKRVIRHAAAEAGIDPDQVGRWSVSGSDNPRYGVPGTMRVNTSGGYFWISAREGPSQRPQVGST